MSTLEKFGILVILILVVIIGVVAVWGVGNGESSPFESTPPADTTTATVPDPGVPTKPADAPAWPASAAANSGAPGAPSPAGPVPPPAVRDNPSPAGGSAPTANVPDPLTVPAAGETNYTILKGDTGAGIALKTLGSKTRWPEIQAANKGVDARRLRIGQVLRIPSGTAVARAPEPITHSRPPVSGFQPNADDGPTNPTHLSAPESAGTAAPALREVEVKDGDTLYAIAQRELGNPNLYKKILDVNAGLDPRKLRKGMRIKVPAAQ